MYATLRRLNRYRKSSKNTNFERMPLDAQVIASEGRTTCKVMLSQLDCLSVDVQVMHARYIRPFKETYFLKF